MYSGCKFLIRISQHDAVVYKLKMQNEVIHLFFITHFKRHLTLLSDIPNISKAVLQSAYNLCIVQYFNWFKLLFNEVCKTSKSLFILDCLLYCIDFSPVGRQLNHD